MDTMKYKDQSPEKTVKQITKILEDLGIQTHLEWYSKGVFGCFSNRVTIDGTTIGTNGKGTSEAYAKASAYAELMERLQNDMTYLGKHDKEVLRHKGVWFSHDEVIQSAHDMVSEDNAFYDVFFARNGCRNATDKLAALKQWDFGMTGKNDEYVCVPFLSVKKREATYLPIGFCQSIYASNGMCAGNTMEEALVQGVSEILERHACKALIYDGITPPDVPDEYVSQFGDLYGIIQKIRSKGHYKVIIKDCSLGKGYPVTAAIIIDQTKGTFGVKFAAHPVFSIALERTLTEALQGKSLDEFTSLNRIGDSKQVMHRDNILNIFKTGTGYYPAELLGRTPHYPFAPPAKPANTSNKDMLTSLLQTVMDDGGDVLIRDVSFMGFPSYYVIVPGMSEMFMVDRLRSKEQHTLLYISNMLNRLPEASEEELELLVNMSLLKHNSIIENQIGVFLGRPFSGTLPGGEYATQFLLFACLYQLNRLQEAYDVIKTLKGLFRDTEQAAYYNAVTTFVKFEVKGVPEDDRLPLLVDLYGEFMGERVFQQFAAKENVIRNLYPKFNCWDCDDCESVDICRYPETANVHKKLREQALESQIKQEDSLSRIPKLNQSGEM